MTNKITQLKDELTDIRTQFETRTSILSDKIDQLKTKQLSVLATKVAPQKFAEIVEPTIEFTADTSKVDEQIKCYFSEDPQPLPEPALQPAPKVAGKSFITALLEDFGPLSTAFSKGFAVYEHYRNEGKTAAFLMTFAGLIAMTFGFGYLLQYSFYQLMSDGIKVGLGYFVSAGFVGVGGWLTLKKPQFSEYSSSLIGLGVVLAYLNCYFSGPYFNLIGSTASFFILLLITFLAYGLALKFETRIVAVITLLGGTLCPFMFTSDTIIASSFVAYLMLLSAANLHLSRKIKWPALAQLAFVLCLSVIEFSGFAQTGNATSVMLQVSQTPSLVLSLLPML